MSGKTKAAIFKLRFRLVLYLIAALILIMPLRTALEHHFLYFPLSRHEATPASIGLQYEEVEFHATDGIQLFGWLIPGRESAPVVLFCMGNAGNISHRLETLQMLHDLGVASFIFDYRGYGRSGGKTSETGLYHDAAAAMALLQERGWRADRIIIFGRSLGAAVGMETALRIPPAGLIIEAAFTSIHAMGRYHYPLLSFLLGWMIEAKFDNLGKIGDLKSPVLLIQGRNDTICPPAMAKQLYSRAADRKQIYWIDAAGHNNGPVVGGAAYREVLRQAIAGWTGTKESIGAEPAGGA
jgi:hypothetical protein